MNRYSYDLEVVRNQAIKMFNSNNNLTCKQIADELGISSSTVSNYLKYLPGYRRRGVGRKR